MRVPPTSNKKTREERLHTVSNVCFNGPMSDGQGYTQVSALTTDK